MKKEFKKVTDRLMEVNLGIKTLINTEIPNADNEDFENFQAEVENFLAEKDLLIEKLQELKNRSAQEFSELKEKEFAQTWQKICEMEAGNFEEMQRIQKEISQELIGNKTHSRVISSYKFTKEIQPRLFDDSL